MNEFSPEGLRQKCHCSQPSRVLKIHFIFVGPRFDDDARRRPALMHPLNQPKTRIHRHDQIDDQNLRRIFFHQCQRGGSRLGFNDIVPPSKKPGSEHAPDDLFIVHNENACGFRHRDARVRPKTAGTIKSRGLVRVSDWSVAFAQRTWRTRRVGPINSTPRGSRFNRFAPDSLAFLRIPVSGNRRELAL